MYQLLQTCLSSQRYTAASHTYISLPPTVNYSGHSITVTLYINTGAVKNDGLIPLTHSIGYTEGK